MTHDTAPTPKVPPTDATGAPEGAPAMSAADRAFASIRAGLDKYFPNEPYLTDATLSETLGMTQMTLANRRSMDPAKYPTPLKLGGARTGVHPRAKFIDWLAREELAAKARIAHRCR